MSHQKIAISQIEHTPQLVIRQTLHSIFIKMHKPAGFGIKQFYTFPIGGNPEFTIGRGVICVISFVAMLEGFLPSCL